MTFRQTIEYGFILKLVRHMIITYSHLLILVINLALISCLLYFSKLLWNSAVHYLFAFFRYFLFAFFLLSHFASFLVILYYPLLFWSIPLFLLTIYLFLKCNYLGEVSKIYYPPPPFKKGRGSELCYSNITFFSISSFPDF